MNKHHPTEACSLWYKNVPRAGSPGYLKGPRAGSPGHIFVPRAASPGYIGRADYRLVIYVYLHPSKAINIFAPSPNHLQICKFAVTPSMHTHFNFVFYINLFFVTWGPQGTNCASQSMSLEWCFFPFYLNALLTLWIGIRTLNGERWLDMSKKEFIQEF